MAAQFAIGVDYGTNSVRALVVDIADGRGDRHARLRLPQRRGGHPARPDATRTWPARTRPTTSKGFVRVGDAAPLTRPQRHAGFRRRAGRRHRRRHHRLDADPGRRRGAALALKPEFKNNLAAHAWLWKDHTSHAEAAEITATGPQAERAVSGEVRRHLLFGVVLVEDPALHCAPRPKCPRPRRAGSSWPTSCPPTSPATPTRRRWPAASAPPATRRCTTRSGAACRAPSFSTRSTPGLVALALLDPSGRRRTSKAGELTAEVAATGRPAGGHPGGGRRLRRPHGRGRRRRDGQARWSRSSAPAPATACRRRWTSELPDIPGLCGIVPESILPGMYGLEAGQSAVGDIFNWFVKHLAPGEYGNEATRTPS